jgi:nitrilase
MASFTAAVVQAAAAGFDLDAGLEEVERLARQASEGGASLAVFPEAFLPAYPRGITFGTVVGDRTREGREHFRRYFDASVDVPGPVVDRLAEIAAETALHLVIWCRGARPGGRSTARPCSSLPTATWASTAS